MTKEFGGVQEGQNQYEKTSGEERRGEAPPIR